MFPGGNGNADMGYNKHPHAHGHGHGHSHNQFLAQPPPPPPHFSLPPGGGPGIMNPLVATSLPLGMQGGAGIDWAQLAQQWIHMRDAGPAAVSMPVSACPPPPVIGNVRDYHHPQQTLALPLTSVVRAGYPGVLEEHGEADMDMDDDNERGHGAETPPPPAPVVTQSQWLSVSEPPALSVPASSDAAVTLGKQQWSSNWHTQPGKAATATGNPTAHIPSLLKINVSNPNEPHQQLQLQPPQQQPTQPHHQPATHQQHQQQSQQQHPQQPQQHQQQQHLESGGGASSELDANKRKMLPAWIREGLEKMEREKQRQLERQQSSSQVPSDMTDAAVDVHVKQVSSKTLTTPVNLLNIASVASDSEDSIGLPAGVELGVGVGGELKEQQIGNELLSKATTDGTSDSSDDDQQEEQRREREDVVKATVSVKDDDVNGKNYEERLADLMLVVRRTLTEILLETTNEEIAAIAGETLKAHRAKASSAQVIRKSALSSITGNLGLAAYGDSSSESEEDEDEEDGERQADAGKDLDKSVHLSAEELKARIRRSKRSFERVINDIEDRVAKQEHRDEQTLQRHRKRELERSDNAGEQRRPLAHPESLGETASRPTHEKLQQYNGKRPSRKERTTRFSDNKDGKQQSSQSYVQQVVATVATVAPPASLSSSSVPAKLKPVPNVATNLLQMPESVATMLSAADKALNKANKSSSRKPKSKRRHSSTSSSTSSSDSSSSSSSNSDDSSSSTSGASKTSSSRSKRSSRHGHRSQHGSSSTSRSKYDRRDRHRERERDRDRERERDRRHDRHHYSGGGSSSSHRQRQQRHRGSSHSAEDDGGGGGGSSSHHRSSRPSSSRSHDHGSSTSGRKRHRTRSRSKSRSTHHSSSNAYTSSSSASHSRKRH